MCYDDAPQELGMRFTDKCAPRHLGTRTNGHQANGHRRNGHRKNGHQDKWAPGQEISTDTNEHQKIVWCRFAQCPFVRCPFAVVPNCLVSIFTDVQLSGSHLFWCPIVWFPFSFVQCLFVRRRPSLQLGTEVTQCR